MTDQRIIDVLIAKERMEYQETMNCWKMNDQLLGGFIQGDGGKPVEGTFLQKFYQGESVVCPFRSSFPLLVSPRRIALPLLSAFGLGFGLLFWCLAFTEC